MKVEKIEIEVVGNGYIVAIEANDICTERHVFESFEDVEEYLRDALGLDAKP